MYILLLQKVGSVEAEHQEQVRGLEGRLEESSQERETLLREVDTLRDSLQQVTQLKTTAEETIVKVHIHVQMYVYVACIGPFNCTRTLINKPAF